MIILSKKSDDFFKHISSEFSNIRQLLTCEHYYAYLSNKVRDMIAQKDREIIISYAKEFKVREIYLFGSSLGEEEANDIDLAVRGVSPGLFFDFYGKLLRHLSKPVDIVNLSKKTRFAEFIEKQAVKIYG